MTKEESLIISAYTGIMVCSDISELHAFIEKTLNRAVLTHEMSDKELWDELKVLLQDDLTGVIDSSVCQGEQTSKALDNTSITDVKKTTSDVVVYGNGDLLVKFTANWADEMDVEGLFLITQEDWEAFKKMAKEHFEKSSEVIYSVGSNQDIEFESYEDLMDSYEIISADITADGIGILNAVNFLPVGFTGPGDYVFEIEDEDEEQEDDNEDYN